MRDFFDRILSWRGDGDGLREFAEARQLDVTATYKALALSIHPNIQSDSRAEAAYQVLQFEAIEAGVNQTEFAWTSFVCNSETLRGLTSLELPEIHRIIRKPCSPADDSTIERLPVEIINAIVDELSLEDLRSIMLTCQKFFNCSRGRDTFESLCYALFPRYIIGTMIHPRDAPTGQQRGERFLLRHAMRVRYLKVEIADPHLSSSDLRSSNRKDEIELGGMLSHILELESLELSSGITFSRDHWTGLRQLRRLSTPCNNLPYLTALQLEDLTLIYFKHEIEEYRGAKYPPSLLSLTLIDARIRVLPHIDLDELGKLKRLAIIEGTEDVRPNEMNLISATKPTSDLEYVEIHSIPINLGWLSYTKDSLRHLVLSNIQRANLPHERVKLEYVQVVELLWFDRIDNTLLSDFQGSFDFPGLKYFSVSQNCKREDLSHTLTLAERYAVTYDLEVFALRLLNESTAWENSVIPFDISSTYNVINQGRQTKGYPKRCLIHGMVQVPPNHINTPSFHIEVDKFPYPYDVLYAKDGSREKVVEEAPKTRAKLLYNVDEDKCFSETQETQRFGKRRDRHVLTLLT